MSDKNFEEKLKKHWREEADSIPVPDSLHPAKIEEMIDKKMEVPKNAPTKNCMPALLRQLLVLRFLSLAQLITLTPDGNQKKEPLLPIRSKPPRTDTSLSAIPVIQKFMT